MRALALFLFLFAAICGAQKPKLSRTYFENFPARLFFFDDTTNVLYHDVEAGNVWLSEDEGKQWKQVTEIPKGEAMRLIEHPFNNRRAYVLTKGQKHYRTENRGQTWQGFEMPGRPAYVSSPLSFHSDEAKSGYILYQGEKCTTGMIPWIKNCVDEVYITKNDFGDEPKLLLSDVSHCQFAHSTKDFKHSAPSDLIYCVAYDTSAPQGPRSLESSRLYSSKDFFDKDRSVVDLGIGKNARGVIAMAVVSKFATVALKDVTKGDGSMLLFVSIDAEKWQKAQFPRSTSATLRENAYTVVESTMHSLAVDVLLHPRVAVGTLFVSNSDGTQFVQSLENTNRNEIGYVDYENIYGVDGIGITNIVSNADEVVGHDAKKRLRSMITFDDGSNWSRIKPPSTDSNRQSIKCDPNDEQKCSLHFHSVTNAHNFGRVFSSPAPGVVMAVGSIGEYLDEYEESDTFLSTDAGVTWTMVHKDAHKYEFGDSGSIIVMVGDEEKEEEVRYSTNFGKTWQKLDIGVKMSARALVTIPDSTSQKFLLIGQVSRKDQNGHGRFITIFLDFAPTRKRQCSDNDFEKWYARSLKNKECLMGRKQWYKRRNLDADCYVGHKFEDPVGHEEPCVCTDDDYECDFNYVRNGARCVALGPEPVPSNVCKEENTYMGSSGWRLIPGNQCNKQDSASIRKDKKVQKSCSQAQPADGEVQSHKVTEIKNPLISSSDPVFQFEFASPIAQHEYFKESKTILVRLNNGSIWQSSNEGYTWSQPVPGLNCVVFYMHAYNPERAYLLTGSKEFYYTTDTGQHWYPQEAPHPPNTFHVPLMHFNPAQAEYIIWNGDAECDGNNANCHVESHYTSDNGRHWKPVEKYVRNCDWARSDKLKLDYAQILCESYKEKSGNQQHFGADNHLQLVSGHNFYHSKAKMFEAVVGFAKFSEFLIVAEYQEKARALDIQVSVDGQRFATGLFPPSMKPENHVSIQLKRVSGDLYGSQAYTVLESSTNSVFLHVTTSEAPSPPWGSILKSNSNGTYYTISLDNVNRDDRGLVDFEKMIGLDGVAVVNVVANPQQAALSGRKYLQTKITHNDGGSWKSLSPPSLDSLGRKYECQGAKCSLNIHGYTERPDTRATYSSPSIPGVMMAVGNVGEALAPYTDSDTFLSWDAGFTWEEVHKDAHLWEFGDSGSILVMVNDEEPTNNILYTTDEGRSWKEFQFSDDKIRVTSIKTVHSDTSRRFVLLGYYPKASQSSVAIQVDFSNLTGRQCILNVQNSQEDDFELWSPSEEREERCLFGRQTLYHRRLRDRNCYVGDQQKEAVKVQNNCTCRKTDFECEFNHVRNDNGDCVLSAGLSALPGDQTVCMDGEDFWYDRTAYRKIPFSSCEGGERLDRGAEHRCPGLGGHGFFFWLFVVFIPITFAGIAGFWFYKKSGLTRGTIRLGEPRTRRFDDSGPLATLASVPWYIVGTIGILWERAAAAFGGSRSSFSFRRRTGGYRSVPVDPDAQVLRFEDEE